MSNPSGAKGNRFARVVADYLAEHLDDRIDRRVNTGARDKGDIGGIRVAGHRVVVECKNHARMELAAWLDEAIVEARNDDALLGVVVHKRRGRGDPGEQYATMRLADLMALLRVADG